MLRLEPLEHAVEEKAQDRGCHCREEQPGESEHGEITEDLERPEEPEMILQTHLLDAPGNREVQAHKDAESREYAAEECLPLRRRESVAKGRRDRGEEGRQPGSGEMTAGRGGNLAA